ncbi:MAG TPA: BatA and WFA domain-containing protein [Anaerolineae bacterium]|nr:BatA and WFA domain-containing protein [Anaerolineae bacterium]
MTLLVPLALLGLLTLPLIILLHLLRSQRQQVVMPSLLLWRGLEQEKEGGAPRKIPWSLMLMLQLAAATLLTCGLARPVLSFLLDRPQQTIFVLDTTTSMTAADVTGAGGAASTRFEVARATIQSALEDLSESDRIAVVSLGPQPELLLAGSGDQRAALLSTLDHLLPGATGANLTEALSLAGGLVEPDLQSQIVVLTDGNFTVEAEALPAVPAPVTWRFIPDNAEPVPNQALFDVSARPLPDGRYRLFARVINYGDLLARRTLRLVVDGETVDEASLDLEPQSDATYLWTVSAGADTAAVEIVETDVLPLDNRAELRFVDSTRRRALLISAEPTTLARALEVQPGLDLTVIEPEEWPVPEPSGFDLLVFDNPPASLTDWPRGNIWLVNPPVGHPLLPVDNVVVNLRPDVSTASTMLAGIDLSGVYFPRVARLVAPDWATVDLLGTSRQIESQPPLIFHGSTGQSRVAVWAFDLDASNLPARLALPLLTANTLEVLLSPVPPAAIDLGEPVRLPANYSVEAPDGQRLFLNDEGAASENLFSRTKQPGLYRVYDQNNILAAGFAVHAGSSQESNLTQRQSLPDLESRLQAASLTSPAADTLFNEYWPWLAGLALLVIMIEGGLAWRR